MESTLVWLKRILKNTVLYDILKSWHYTYFEDHYLKDIFNKRNQDKVLISYITKPFIKDEIDNSHTNTQEARVIANLFDSLGYSVDVLHFMSKKKVNYSNYKFIFGFGIPFENSFLASECKLVRINYTTGMHVFFQNSQSLKRVSDVKKKYGVNLVASARIVKENWSLQTSLSDYLVILGNENVVNSFKPEFFGTKIFNLQVSYNESNFEIDEIKNKNFTSCRNEFIWFGSSGLVHKGLDLVLEFFYKNPQLVLHVCGPVSQEPEFEELFKEQLYSTPNIHTYGFVDIKSELYSRLIRRCAFGILPSCSESGPTSVLNLMATGIIPVISNSYCGLENILPEYNITDLNCNGIEEAMCRIKMKSDNDLRLDSLKVYKETRRRYSLEVFQKEFKTILKEVIDK